MNKRTLCSALTALTACTAGTQPGASPTRTAATYWLYVANESADLVSRVAFTPGNGVRVDADVPVGIMPADIDGPHGLAVSPDGRAWFVSVAHGTPNGRVWKYAAGADTAAGRVELGNFPASMTTSADGQFLYVANFNLHGDPVPSSVSIVYTPTMAEVARPVTCIMPHGSRINVAGSHHYSTCMH
ncbi:MAG: YncE family protein, partial [Longimicrobiales bacterium]